MDEVERRDLYFDIDVICIEDFLISILSIVNEEMLNIIFCFFVYEEEDNVSVVEIFVFFKLGILWELKLLLFFFED